MELLTKPVLPFVEIMITQACNISCYGCTNYSDLAHKGYLTWDQGRAQIEPWVERVEIPDFGILGGEPLLNPEVRQWLHGLRELLPNAQLRFTTNGILLDRNFDIVELLADIGNCVLKIGVHTLTPELEATINKVYNSYNWEEVVEYGIKRFKTRNNFRFYVRRPDIFWKTYRNSYVDMMPHNNDPVEAFKVCCQQTCPLLYNGQLYKCSTSGLLKDTLARFDNPNNTEWEPYIKPGLSPNCSNDDLCEFLDNFGKPEKLCSQCPTANDVESKIIHINNVSLRKVRTS